MVRQIAALWDSLPKAIKAAIPEDTQARILAYIGRPAEVRTVPE